MKVVPVYLQITAEVLLGKVQKPKMLKYGPYRELVTLTGVPCKG